MKKYPLNEECLLEVLNLRNKDIKELGRTLDFDWSYKSIERGLKNGEVSEKLLDALGRYLDVDPDYLSGKYHKELQKLRIKNININLSAKNFPYIKKQQRIKYDDRFLYDKYLEFILIIHNISLKQFEELAFEQQKNLQLDLEDAIINVLLNYFSKDASGQELFPEIYKIENEIDCYEPNEPSETDDEWFNIDYDDRFMKKYDL